MTALNELEDLQGEPFMEDQKKCLFLVNVRGFAGNIHLVQRLRDEKAHMSFSSMVRYLHVNSKNVELDSFPHKRLMHSSSEHNHGVGF